MSDELDRFVSELTTRWNADMIERWMQGNEKAQPFLRAIARHYDIDLTGNVSLVCNENGAYITPDYLATPIQWIPVDLSVLKPPEP